MKLPQDIGIRSWNFGCQQYPGIQGECGGDGDPRLVMARAFHEASLNVHADALEAAIRVTRNALRRMRNQYGDQEYLRDFRGDVNREIIAPLRARADRMRLVERTTLRGRPNRE